MVCGRRATAGSAMVPVVRKKSRRRASLAHQFFRCGSGGTGNAAVLMAVLAYNACTPMPNGSRGRGDSARHAAARTMHVRSADRLAHSAAQAVTTLYSAVGSAGFLSGQLTPCALSIA